MTGGTWQGTAPASLKGVTFPDLRESVKAGDRLFVRGSCANRLELAISQLRNRIVT